MQDQIKKLEKECLATLKKIKTSKDLKDLEVKYLGRKGQFTSILRGIQKLSKAEKPVIGKLANITKNKLEKAITKHRQTLEEELNKDFFDTSIPGQARPVGHIHPMSQVQEEVERIFSQMGFAIMDGPEVESEYYNFEGLNIPKDHPARDMQDTFFIQDKDDPKHGKMVLRTHTSPVQVRTMEKYGAPLRVIVPGRVFRYEATDASHDTTFGQVEGLLVDKDISLSHLKGVLAEFLTRLFGKPVKVRFRPGYFPFVEPGLEVDFSCLICNGKGCKTCKNSGWIEFMGAGMVHENVLKKSHFNGTTKWFTL